MTAEEVLYFAGSRDHVVGWLLSATTERGPLEGDPDNSVIALYCIDDQRGAHTVSLHFILNQSLSWGPRPARGPKQLLGLLALSRRACADQPLWLPLWNKNIYCKI